MELTKQPSPPQRVKSCALFVPHIVCPSPRYSCDNAASAFFVPPRGLGIYSLLGLTRGTDSVSRRREAAPGARGGGSAFVNYSLTDGRWSAIFAYNETQRKSADCRSADGF